MTDRSLTYVVVADVEAAHLLSGDAAPWVADGLVAPFLVVASPSLDSPDDPWGLWAGQEGEVPCLAAAAAEPYGTVRVLAYQEVRAGSSGNARVPQAALELRDRLRARLAPTQDLYLVNMVVPDDRVRGLPWDLLLLHATANVVVAPEDRASPERASYDLQETWRHRGHGLMALFAVGGLWRHQKEGPFDQHNESSMAEVPHVALVRSFGRIVRDPDMVQRIAQQIFAKRADPAWLARATGARASADPDSILDAQTAALLTQHRAVLSAPQIRPVKAPPIAKIGVLGAFAMMLRFIFTGLKQLPGQARSVFSDAVRRAVGEFAQSVVFGNESTIRVDRPERGGVVADEVDEAHDVAASLLRRAGGASAAAPANGELWRDLRGLAFGLQDGGPLPAGYVEPKSGTEREVVPDPSSIAPDPAEGAFTPDAGRLPLPSGAGNPIRPCDLLQARTLAEHLDTLIERRSGSTEEPVQPLSKEDRKHAKAELTRLEKWIAARERSLLGRIADHLGGQIVEGRDVLAKALHRVKAGAPDTLSKQEVVARARLLRLWKIAIVVVLLAAALRAWYVVATGVSLGLLQHLQWLGWALVGLVVWMLVTFVRYQRQIFRIRHRLERGLAEFEAALDTALHAAKQLLVLTTNYRHLRDWGEIIGWVSHHPYSDPSREISEGSVQVDRLPASHRIAYVIDGGSKDQRLASRIGRNVFGRGWLSSLYSEVELEVMSQLRHDLDLPDVPDPDWEPGDPSPRDHLLEVVASGTPAERWTVRRLQQISTLLGSITAEELFSEVQDVADGTVLDGEVFLDQVLEDFAPGANGPSALAQFLWEPQARMAQLEAIVQVDVWSTTPVDEQVREPAIVRATTAAAQADRAAQHEAVLIRVDRTGSVPASELQLFTAVAATVQPEPVLEDVDASDVPW